MANLIEKEMKHEMETLVPFSVSKWGDDGWRTVMASLEEALRDQLRIECDCFAPTATIVASIFPYASLEM